MSEVKKKRTLQAIDLNGSPLDQFGGNEWEVWEDENGKVHLTFDKEHDMNGEKIEQLDETIEKSVVLQDMELIAQADFDDHDCDPQLDDLVNTIFAIYDVEKEEYSTVPIIKEIKIQGVNKRTLANAWVTFYEYVEIFDKLKEAHSQNHFAIAFDLKYSHFEISEEPVEWCFSGAEAYCKFMLETDAETGDSRVSLYVYDKENNQDIDDAAPLFGSIYLWYDGKGGIEE